MGCDVTCPPINCQKQVLPKFQCPALNCSKVTLAVDCGAIKQGDFKCPTVNFPGLNCGPQRCPDIKFPDFNCPKVQCTFANINCPQCVDVSIIMRLFNYRNHFRLEFDWSDNYDHSIAIIGIDSVVRL